MLTIIHLEVNVPVDVKQCCQV